MTKYDNLFKLYDKFLRGECTAAELRRLAQIFETTDREVLETLVKERLLNDSATITNGPDYSDRYDRIFGSLKHRIEPPVKKVKQLWLRIAAAACITLFIGVGAYYLLIIRQDDQQNTLTAKVNVEIRPGGDKASLTLSNGNTIKLSTHTVGVIGNDAGEEIVKTSDGWIRYVERHINLNAFKTGKNVLRTPKGGQYKVILPDGTKVWLNAESVIKYPANFKGMVNRQVVLEGEAYFEVAKNSAQPFIVQTDDQQIRVLGTHFNVNAYHDDGGSKTTLLEGRISASLLDSEVFVSPGEQVTTRAGKLSVANVDTELAIAWKNDQFMFDSEPIQQLMKRLARWYDVKVIYTDQVRDIRFNGGISKFENISAVLKILESTGKVHFKITGRTIYVSK